LVPKQSLGTRGHEALLRHTHTGRRARLAVRMRSPRSRASRPGVPKQSLGTRANEGDEAEVSDLCRGWLFQRNARAASYTFSLRLGSNTAKRGVESPARSKSPRDCPAGPAWGGTRLHSGEHVLRDCQLIERKGGQCRCPDRPSSGLPRSLRPSWSWSSW